MSDGVQMSFPAMVWNALKDSDSGKISLQALNFMFSEFEKDTQRAYQS